MRQFESDITDAFITEEEAKDYNLDSEAAVEDFILTRLGQFFYDDKDFKKYCDLYAQLIGLKPYAMLNGHGNANEKGQWIYQDGGINVPVQNWVSSQDGRYGTLLVGACNPDSKRVQAKTSLLWYGNGDVIVERCNANEFNFELVVPNSIVDILRKIPKEALNPDLIPQVGTINSYVIESEVEKLKRIAHYINSKL